MIIIQRLVELWWSQKNEKYLRQHGAFELGAKNFFWMKLMHVLFFPAMVMEYLALGKNAFFVSWECPKIFMKPSCVFLLEKAEPSGIRYQAKPGNERKTQAT